MIGLILALSLSSYADFGYYRECVNDASAILHLGYVHTRLVRTDTEPEAWSRAGANGHRTVYITSSALKSKDHTWLRHTAYHEACHLWLHMKGADYRDEALTEMCADALEAN